MHNHWTHWRPASCLPDCWCEAPRFGQLIVEPANTWSNIAYFIAAFLGLYLVTKRATLPSNPISQGKFYFIMFFIAMFLVGFGSTFFHMSLTFIGQWVDVMGMYFITLFFILYNFRRMDLIQNWHFLVLYFGINSILGFVIYYYPESRRWLFGMFLILALVTTLYANIRTYSTTRFKYFLFSLGSIIIAQVGWNIDRMKIVCDPYALFNGHVVWHLFCAVSGYYLFKYFAYEEMDQVLEKDMSLIGGPDIRLS